MYIMGHPMGYVDKAKEQVWKPRATMVADAIRHLRRHAAATSAPGLGLHPRHICAGTLRRDSGSTRATSAPGLGTTRATSAPGLGSPLRHLRRDWAQPLPHLGRDWARPCDIWAGTGLAPCHICAGTGRMQGACAVADRRRQPQ